MDKMAGDEEHMKDIHFVIPYDEMMGLVHKLNNCIQAVTFLRLKSELHKIADECIKELAGVNTSLRLSKTIRLDIEDEK